MDSPKRLARIAGVLNLLVAVFGGLAYFVDRKVYVSGNARPRLGKYARTPDLCIPPSSPTCSRRQSGYSWG